MGRMELGPRTPQAPTRPPRVLFFQGFQAARPQHVLNFTGLGKLVLSFCKGGRQKKQVFVATTPRVVKLFGSFHFEKGAFLFFAAGPHQGVVKSKPPWHPSPQTARGCDYQSLEPPALRQMLKPGFPEFRWRSEGTYPSSFPACLGKNIGGASPELAPPFLIFCFCWAPLCFC